MVLHLRWTSKLEENEMGMEISEKLKSNNQVDLIKEDIDIPDYIKTIILLIQQNILDLLTFDHFSSVFDYIKKIYSMRNCQISPNIISLLNDINFKKYLNDRISWEIPKILNDNSSHSFENISFYIFLLGLWTHQNLLIDLNTYDFKKIDSLFEEYILKILVDWNDKQEIDVFFYSFVNLFELMNKLSILNEIDTSRKFLIPTLVAILNKYNSKLEIILSDKWMLDEEKKNILHHLTSKLLINFSHIWYINIWINNLDNILDDILNIINHQVKWYNGALESHFWNNLSNKKSNYQAFIWNMAYIVSIMINKITHFEVVDLNEKITEIITLFLQNINFDSKTVTNIQDLQNMCNSIFRSIYFNDEQEDYSEIKVLNAKNPISDFISKSENVSEYQMESIHHLVIFWQNTSIEEYLDLGMFLVNTKKFNNFNFEFFKLKTLDIIISKLKNTNNDENINIFLAKLVIYIEDNKIASQLFNTYSRLYLSIAYYYSNGVDKKSIELALEFFTVFFKMWWEKVEFFKYGKKIDDFYYNIWLYKLNSTLCNEWINPECGINICHTSNPNCVFDKNQAIAYWKEKVSHYGEIYELKLKSDLDRVLSDLLENALNQEWIENSEINRKISVILSNKIFHWISETYIVDWDNDVEFINDLTIHNWIEYFQIDLFSGYKLIFTYPKIYEDAFKTIYDRENYYIVRNIKNIITSYLKRKDLYTDHNTWLPNELKLKSVLSDLKWTISFISIKLNTLKNINNWYNYELWNEYIENVALALMNIKWFWWCVYRLSWAKIWIIITDKSIDIDDIIIKIKNIKFQIWWLFHRLDSIIWVVVNEQFRIVEKSHSALLHSKSSYNWVAYYHEDINDSAKNKELLEYLEKLDKAIDEDRIVPFYQPKFDARTKKIVSYEALLRVKKLDWSFDWPYKYLLSADSFWRLISITDIMIKKVFEFASTHTWNFSINLSWDDLKNERLLKYIDEINQIYKIDPKRITFEILEWEWNEWWKNLLIIQELKKSWFKIAMDDFWAMSSNINRLLDLLKNKQIDYLKIDGKIIKSLIDEDLLQSKITIKLLEWIIESAHIAWVKVIAEFVENEKIANICEFMWIDILQWYYFWIPNETLEIKKEFQERRKL